MTNAAINVDEALQWGLIRTLGENVGVHFAKQPEGTLPPFVTYRFISDRLQDRSTTMAGSMHIGRVQITHVHNNIVGLRSLVNSVMGFLENNQTDFQCSLVEGTNIDDKESDNVLYTIKDYTIQWKAI